MKIFGRKFRIKSLPKKIKGLSSMFMQSMRFKNPYELWLAYFTMRPPKHNMYVLKNGLRFYLSLNPHDSITVMVIFCRKEYGDIARDSTVIDIGANIGAFSIYAAMQGAKKVYAFEPNREAFNILVKNINDNHLQEIIHPFNVAVTSKDNGQVKIQKAASPYNRIELATTAQHNEFDVVNTMSLPSIVNRVGSERIDFLKMDCEGAEYEILYSTPKEVFNKISNIRLEHHDGQRKSELISFLNKNHFEKTFDKNIIMWFQSTLKP